MAQKKKKILTETSGRVYLQCTFNNTIVTVTDNKGNTIVWSSAGSCGFKGTKKGTPFAAQVAAQTAAKRALDLGLKYVSVYVKGPGPGREVAIRAIQNAGLNITAIYDITPIPHNGCRPRKLRRV